ncbi:hypothetical protein [Prevotella sp. Rep29]|uniref:hypothetical protein n=1 Tax=Prevotella sp. Rep29 TaxID=2691580 RepID=UPI001C6E9B4E|nr:hypothetical protein [Prevotella sp. Rep29]QYR09968.1 hypothetical protein GRF55_02040 [Prevotella sp. Rep29]
MNNRIQDTVSGLQVINELLKKYVREGALCLEEKKTIWETYKNIKDTNSLIEDAEQKAHNDIDGLYSDACLLYTESKECTEILKSNAVVFSSFEGETVYKWIVAPYEKSWRTESEKANELWRKYSGLSNRLDSMFYGGCSEEEIKKVEEECDATNEQYKALKKKYEHLYDEYIEARNKWIGLISFDLMLLDVLANKLAVVSQCIMNDITIIKKEGGV